MEKNRLNLRQTHFHWCHLKICNFENKSIYSCNLTPPLCHVGLGDESTGDPGPSHKVCTDTQACNYTRGQCLAYRWVYLGPTICFKGFKICKFLNLLPTFKLWEITHFRNLSFCLLLKSEDLAIMGPHSPCAVEWLSFEDRACVLPFTKSPLVPIVGQQPSPIFITCLANINQRVSLQLLV